MVHKQLLLKILGLLSLLFVFGFLITADVPAQPGIDPRLDHSGCVYHCMMDELFIYSRKDNQSASNSYYAFMTRFWENSSCEDVELLDVYETVTGVAGVPGGASLKCWHFLLAKCKECISTCEKAIPPNSTYGANVKLLASSISPGFLEVTLNNALSKDYYPYHSNGYSGRFYLTTTLQLDGGTPLAVSHQMMPSMSFPNWITSAGYGSHMCNQLNISSECPSCCRILNNLSTPNYIPYTVEFLDGVLYDLSDNVSDKSGVTGSFSIDGFVVLYSDGDRFTINQGPYAGVTWTKVHNKSTGKHYQTINNWDASTGPIKIRNSECDSIFCRPFGDQIEADTYVLALSGPDEKRLSGTYTVQIVANVYHDKDFSNNRISYSYTDQDLDDWQEPSGGDDDTSKPKIDISTLPITVIPGEGVFTYTLPDNAPGMMFRLDVPEDLYWVTTYFAPQDTGTLSAFGKAGSIPVPSYPPANWDEFDCLIYSTPEYDDNCHFQYPNPGPVYYFVEGSNSARSFSIKVEYITNPAITATMSYVQTKNAEYALTQQALIRTFTEVEPNNSRETANEWDRVEPFSGESPRGDEDYIGVTFNESGIYTFGITEVSPETKVFLGLWYRPGGFIETATSKNKGEGVSLTMDASAGERFYFKVVATRYDEDKDGSYYTLELLDFIPDPFEPNDEKADATYWDISQGPIEGYFWEKAHFSLERADYYRFTAPVTADGSAVTFQVTNPSPDISICMSLKNHNGSTIFNPPCTAVGANANLIYTLVPGQDYYIKLFTLKNKTSMQPYSLSASYIGDGNGTGLTEVEPNNSKDTANPWDLQEPFKGVLSTSSDKDYIRIDIPTPGIYTFSVTDVSPNLKVGLYLVRFLSGGRALHSVQALTKGQGVQLTMDGSAGEQYCLVVYAQQWGSDGSLYQLSLTGFIPDPGEPNDQTAEATYWEITEGPIQGYFWERTHWSFYRADYFKFTAPLTVEGNQVTFQVDNPGSDISVCMNLLNHRGNTLLSGQCSPEGEDAFLTQALTAGMDYFLKLFTVNNKASLQPYTLSIGYTPGVEEDLDESSRMIRLHGFIYRQWGLLPLPIANVPVYVHISGQPAFFLDTTNWLGIYSTRVMLADDQEVTVWPELPGTNFVPEEDVFMIEAGLRHHRSVFTVIGGHLDQQTPTPPPEPTDTPEPPFEKPTDTDTPEPLEEIEIPTDTPSATQTPTPTLTPTLTPTPTDTPQPPTSGLTTVIGRVWRLFEVSGPAGVAGAEVILTINGVDQPAVFSQIDGLYLMDVEGIQPGDVLQLRAQAPQDDFEPLYYEWQAEVGVNRWEYDFYSYWDEITPPSSMDQNRIWGTVWDQFLGDVSGLYLNLQMGTSDAIQRIGPTDEDGYFEAMVTLPDRIMVTVWVDAPGYVPSKLMFFHPYEPEDRELIFWKFYGEDIQ